MRVKLSYTVETADVLREAAKILNLSGDDLQQAIALFSSVQNELRGETADDDIVNIKRVKDMMEEFRAALLSVDTRLMEVTEIVVGYDEYQNALAKPLSTISEVADGPPDQAE